MVGGAAVVGFGVAAVAVIGSAVALGRLFCFYSGVSLPTFISLLGSRSEWLCSFRLSASAWIVYCERSILWGSSHGVLWLPLLW